MREIKFRQAIKASGQLPFRWHYWGYINIQYADGEYLTFISPMGSVESDKRESQQFTGLKDRSGREIYEADIVKAGEGTSLKIEWSYGRYVAWDFRAWEQGYYDAYLELAKELGQIQEGYSMPYIEVIGNIYENPELLGEVSGE